MSGLAYGFVYIISEAVHYRGGGIDCFSEMALFPDNKGIFVPSPRCPYHFPRLWLSERGILWTVLMPCPSPYPGIHSNSHPSSQWCHPAISSSVVPFSSCPQSLPASGSFPMSQLFTWGGQSTGISALASFLPKKSQGWSPLGWTGWISLQSKGLSRVFSNTTIQKHQFFGAQPSSQSNSHIHTWLLQKS